MRLPRSLLKFNWVSKLDPQKLYSLWLSLGHSLLRGERSRFWEREWSVISRSEEKARSLLARILRSHALNLFFVDLWPAAGFFSISLLLWSSLFKPSYAHRKKLSLSLKAVWLEEKSIDQRQKQQVVNFQSKWADGILASASRAQIPVYANSQKLQRRSITRILIGVGWMWVGIWETEESGEKRKDRCLHSAFSGQGVCAMQNVKCKVLNAKWNITTTPAHAHRIRRAAD